jgi:hypothetical protein
VSFRLSQCVKKLFSFFVNCGNITRMKFFICLATVMCALTINASAQSAYAGRHWVVCSWGVGNLAGLGSSGPATATRSGQVVITQYFGDDSSATIGATINKKGLFKLNSPNVGSAQIYTAGKKHFASGVVGVASNGYSSGGTCTFSNVYLP